MLHKQEILRSFLMVYSKIIRIFEASMQPENYKLINKYAYEEIWNYT